MFSDPIDEIALRFEQSVDNGVSVYVEITRILETCVTNKEALECIASMGIISLVDVEHPEMAYERLGQYQRCLECMDDIRDLARRVFIVNFYENDPRYIFHKEVCFSYACKMLCTLSPLLCQFASRPCRKELIRAELELSLKTPYLRLMEDDLLCMESMGSADGQQRQASVISVDNLLCSESMPDDILF